MSFARHRGIANFVLQALCVFLLTIQGVQAMAADADQTSAKISSATVTLDVYSGRPNPSWTLSDAVTGELLAKLQALAPIEREVAEFDGLGYRAVRAELRQDGAKIVVSAARGVVTCERGGRQLHYADTGRQFELWLVNTGSGHAPPDVLRYVAGEIAAKP
jgi:hypothetical protein